MVEPEEEPQLIEDQASESPQKRKIDEDDDEVPIVSRRKKKRIVEDDESVDLSLSPKAENEPSPEDDEIIGDEQLDDPFAGQEPFQPPEEESVQEEAPVVVQTPLIPCQKPFISCKKACRFFGATGLGALSRRRRLDNFRLKLLPRLHHRAPDVRLTLVFLRTR